MPRPLSCLLFFALAGLVLPRLAASTSLTVPDDIPTIQAAVDALVDTVLVRPGQYDESVLVLNSVVLLGTAENADELPTISSLRFGNDGPTTLFRRLAFANPIVVGAPLPEVNPTRITRASETTPFCNRFEECELRGGVTDNQDFVDLNCFEFFKCKVTGTLNIHVQISCSVESCFVAGSLSVPREGPGVTVRGCTFEGGGTSHAISTQNTSSLLCEGNTFRNYRSGINSGADDLIIRSNLFEDCSISAVGLGPHGGLVTDNHFMRCGYAISGDAVSGTTITRNVIQECSRTGIWLLADGASLISDNVITGCGGDGISMRGGEVWNGVRVIARNTIAFNAGSGIVTSLTDPYDAGFELRQNIAYANGAHGFRRLGNETAVLMCNDWFGNVAGAVEGQTPGGTDVSTNPMFCDEQNGNFQLLATSPLLNWPGCGQIGALGVGCFPTTVEPSIVGFALAPVRPNPSTGPARIGFSLGHAASIRIDVFDLQGRLVATPAHGSWPSGSHSVAWSAGSAGIYLVRYRYPGGEDRRRLVRIP